MTPQRLIYQGILDKVKSQLINEASEEEEVYQCRVYYERKTKLIKWLVTHLASGRPFRCFINKETHRLNIVNLPGYSSNNYHHLRMFVLFMNTQLVIK